MTRALYRLFLGTQATRGRILGLLALGLMAVLLGFAIGRSQSADGLDDGTAMIAQFGLAVVAPVTTLVFATASLGELHEDGTLVYVWLRPVSRSRIVAAALGATLTITLPLVVLPLALAAGLTGAGGALVGATVAACTVAVVGYAGVFTWLGLRVRRALVWGLGYVLVWEGFVARAGTNTARFSIRDHTRSLLARLADGPERLVEVSLATAIIVPLLAAAVGTWLTVRRLTRQDVA
jgi:ABC-2 type transport system permease protein